MQLQIAINIFYDLMMQCLYCLRSVHDRITLLICRLMISCWTLSHSFKYHYPYIFFCKCHERNLVWSWCGSKEDCIPFLSWNLPYRNCRSILFHPPYHALLLFARFWNTKVWVLEQNTSSIRCKTRNLQEEGLCLGDWELRLICHKPMGVFAKNLFFLQK